MSGKSESLRRRGGRTLFPGKRRNKILVARITSETEACGYSRVTHQPHRTKCRFANSLGRSGHSARVLKALRGWCAVSDVGDVTSSRLMLATGRYGAAWRESPNTTVTTPRSIAAQSVSSKSILRSKWYSRSRI